MQALETVKDGAVDSSYVMAALTPWPILAVRTVPLPDRRVRIRLEVAVWDGLEIIAGQLGRTVHSLCGEVDATRPNHVALTSAIRTYVLEYFRKLA